MKSQRWIATGFGSPRTALEQVAVDVPAPAAGEVTIEVRAAGINPVDFKRIAAGDPATLPALVGFEAAGMIAAIGPDTRIASGGGTVGDDVLAFRVNGAYATAVNVCAEDVFAKPSNLTFPEAANLLLAGTTAAEMLDVTKVRAGETVLLHGGSGAVGLSLLQQARSIGAHVIATASRPSFDAVKRFGGMPTVYGDGLLDRVRALAPDGIDVALDAVGTEEALDTSLALVSDRDRVLTIAAQGRATGLGIRAIGMSAPASATFRAAARARLIDAAAAGSLIVPVVRTYPFGEAVAALEHLSAGHPGGKLALTV